MNPALADIRSQHYPYPTVSELFYKLPASVVAAGFSVTTSRAATARDNAHCGWLARAFLHCFLAFHLYFLPGPGPAADRPHANTPLPAVVRGSRVQRAAAATTTTTITSDDDERRAREPWRR